MMFKAFLILPLFMPMLVFGQPISLPGGSDCHITSVSIGNLSMQSGKPSGYSDYSPLGADLVCGSYPLTVRTNTSGNHTVFVRVWFDWDGDGNFNGPNEQFDLGTVTNAVDGVTSLSPVEVSVPADAVQSVRMRVAVKWNGYPNICEANFPGEVEDYAVSVQREQVPICLVSVDNTSQYNVILWEKPEAASIDSFIVYRESVQNIYQRIGAVAYADSGRFDDYNANPNVTSYRYRLSTLDTCGTESPLSPYHGSIHLQHLGNGNLSWNHYVIEGQQNQVQFYSVYRDNTGNGNFLPITTMVSGTSNTYTDVDHASYPGAAYLVDVTWGLSCDPSRVVTTTRSNFTGLLTGMNGVNQIVFSLSPNPATSSVTLVLPDNSGMQQAVLYNALGQEVLRTSVLGGRNELHLQGLSKGVYAVQVGNVSERLMLTD